MGNWALSLVKVPSRVRKELVRASSDSWAWEGRIPPRNRARRQDDHRIVPGGLLSTAFNDDEGMRLFVLTTAQSMKIHWKRARLDLAIEWQRILPTYLSPWLLLLLLMLLSMDD